MYDNIGDKIKLIAKISGWILLIAGALVWISCIGDSTNRNDGMGWAGLIGGILGFVSSWSLYAFGQLVDDVNVLRNRYIREHPSTNEPNNEPEQV